MTTPKSLYTPAEIKKFKEEQVKKQKGIDPILKEPFKEPTVMDHDHTLQHCRAALNRNTNAFEGLVYNAYNRCIRWLTDKPLPEVLRNLAEYLEQDYSKNPYHTGWIKRVKIDFNKLSTAGKNSVLNDLEGCLCKNDKQRKDEFSRLILTRDHSYVTISALIEKYKG